MTNYHQFPCYHRTLVEIAEEINTVVVGRFVRVLCSLTNIRCGVTRYDTTLTDAGCDKEKQGIRWKLAYWRDREWQWEHVVFLPWMFIYDVVKSYTLFIHSNISSGRQNIDPLWHTWKKRLAHIAGMPSMAMIQGIHSSWNPSRRGEGTSGIHGSFLRTNGGCCSSWMHLCSLLRQWVPNGSISTKHIAILTVIQIGYFLKNLDLNNVTNAYLSGMEEDLSMYGNQLVTSTSIFTVGYVIGQIPSNLLLTRVSPRWVIPAVRISHTQLHCSSLANTTIAWSRLGNCYYLHSKCKIVSGSLCPTISRGPLRVSFTPKFLGFEILYATRG